MTFVPKKKTKVCSHDIVFYGEQRATETNGVVVESYNGIPRGDYFREYINGQEIHHIFIVKDEMYIVLKSHEAVIFKLQPITHDRKLKSRAREKIKEDLK